MTFWFAMALYVSWQMIVYACIFRAIKNQPDEELENAWLTAESATAQPPAKAGA